MPDAGRLVCLPGGKSYLVGAVPLTIGREPSSNVPVHSEEVSRSHAYILRTPQGFLLVDSSLHGTYVNGDRVQAQRILADGDLVQIGAESFRFDLSRADTPPSDSSPMPGEAPETSQYTRTVPLGAGATGKLRLALALAERDSWKSRALRLARPWDSMARWLCAR
ncbi:MAG TPA: FHA domain-containing protein [Gemmatimonadales bacterium]